MSYRSLQYVELCSVPEEHRAELAPYADANEEITLACYVEQDDSPRETELVLVVVVDARGTEHEVDAEQWLTEYARENAEIDAWEAHQEALEAKRGAWEAHQEALGDEMRGK